LASFFEKIQLAGGGILPWKSRWKGKGKVEINLDINYIITAL